MRSLALAALLVAAGVGWWAISSQIAAREAPRIGERIADEGRQHVPVGASIEWRARPPASGTHYPSLVPTGVYAQGVAPGYWVHNLEHGYVVLAYRPPAAPERIDEFEAMVRDFPRSKYRMVKLVVVPYGEMPHPFAVLAWDWRLWMGELDRQKVLEFYRAHVDRGPEDVP